MGCATGIVKFIMFFFNFLFVVGGILMVTAGVLAITGYQDYQHAVNLDSYKTSPILLIVVGCAVFFIAFMGCCGVLRENNCMMMTYAVLMTVILLAQVGIAVGAALYQEDFKDLINKGMQKSMEEYEHRNEVKEAWDSMQGNLKCCGYSEYKNWGPVIQKVPDSCCRRYENGCADGTLNNENLAREKLYTEGCVEKMFAQIKLQYVIIAAAVIAGIELVGILFACCLAARFRRKNYA